MKIIKRKLSLESKFERFMILMSGITIGISFGMMLIGNKTYSIGIILMMVLSLLFIIISIIIRRIVL